MTHIKVPKFPSDLLLVGSHDGLLYFVPEIPKKDISYMAFHGNLEVKRRYLGTGDISAVRVFNALFSCFGYIKEKWCLLVLDLNTDTTLVRLSLTEFGLNYRFSSTIPVVRECSDLQSTE